jgi:hypothetical protein
VRFSPDGSTLALGCGDNSIHLFAVTAQGRRYRRAGVCRGHTAEVYTIQHTQHHQVHSARSLIEPDSAFSTNTCVRLHSKQLFIRDYSVLQYVCTAVIGVMRHVTADLW